MNISTTNKKDNRIYKYRISAWFFGAKCIKLCTSAQIDRIAVYKHNEVIEMGKGSKFHRVALIIIKIPHKLLQKRRRELHLKFLRQTLAEVKIATMHLKFRNKKKKKTISLKMRLCSFAFNSRQNSSRVFS